MKKEDGVYQDILEQLGHVFSDSSSEEILRYVKKTVEDAECRAFMEGYKYAISLLKESMVHKDGQP